MVIGHQWKPPSKNPRPSPESYKYDNMHTLELHDSCGILFVRKNVTQVPEYTG